MGGRWPEWPLEVNVGAITLFVFYASTSLFLMLLVFYIRIYNKCVPLASSQSSTFSISIHIPQLCRSKVIQLEFPVCVYCRRSSRGFWSKPPVFTHFDHIRLRFAPLRNNSIPFTSSPSVYRCTVTTD